MQFPEAARVIYKNNPLISVICQLTFPPILKIDQEAPVAFQELIRKEYPVLEETHGIDLPPQIGSLPIRLGNVRYNFSDHASDNKIWAVSLTQGTLSLTTSNYQRWEEFKERLALPLKALLDVYSPAFFTRIGLRYQNVISRERLGVAAIAWRDLLRSPISGFLSTVDNEDDIEHQQGLGLIKVDEIRKVLLQHGFVREEGNSERLYLIDNDFYVEIETEVSNVVPALDSLNNGSGRLFRWCITERLHNALDPQPA